ncbi:MAG: hypothetical protein ABL966_09775 [Acidimicrobiales bacterium]
MLRSVTTHDPDIDDDDRASALEWQHEDGLKCDRCGLPSDETTAADAEDLFDAELWICHACAGADRAIDTHRREEGSMAGVRTRIIHRTPVVLDD